VRSGSRLSTPRRRKASAAPGRWQPVTNAAFLAASVGILTLLLLLASDDDGFLLVLDHANLVFHEAGHVFYGMLGPTAGLYGGTLGQLTFPAATCAVFLRRGEPVPVALTAVWLFQNFLNISRYVADARVQQLPLVGGGDHDWFRILGRWGMLSSGTTLASLLSLAGWIGMVAAWVWSLWRWSQEPR
jgi:hypothetical protein